MEDENHWVLHHFPAGAFVHALLIPSIKARHLRNGLRHLPAQIRQHPFVIQGSQGPWNIPVTLKTGKPLGETGLGLLSLLSCWPKRLQSVDHGLHRPGRNIRKLRILESSLGNSLDARKLVTVSTGPQASSTNLQFSLLFPFSTYFQVYPFFSGVVPSSFCGLSVSTFCYFSLCFPCILQLFITICTPPAFLQLFQFVSEFPNSLEGSKTQNRAIVASIPPLLSHCRLSHLPFLKEFGTREVSKRPLIFLVSLAMVVRG